MNPSFVEPADFVLQDEDVFLQLFRDESISAWAHREEAGHWEAFCPELDVKEFNVSARRCSPFEASQRVIGLECADPEPEPAKSDSDFHWLKEHVEKHLGRHAVEDRLVARYLSVFPDELLRKIATFPSRQWEVLAAVGRRPELLDLLETNPALFYLAATKCIGNKPDETLLDTVGNRPRRELCGALGLPATSSMVRILGKVRAESCSPELLDSLIVNAGDDRRLNLLRHLPRLPLSSILIMAEEWTPRIVTDDFYFEVDQVGPGERLREALRSLFALSKESPERLDRCLPCPGGISELIAGGDRLSNEEEMGPPQKTQTREELRAIRAAEDQEGEREFLAGKRTHSPAAPKFPSPPFPPPHGSLAITDQGMLAQEAASQSNCVLEYQEHLLARSYVLFRMLIPERATFEILRDGATWKLGQVKRARNLPVQPETMSLLLTWFNQAMRTLWDAENAMKKPNTVKRRRREDERQTTFELF